VTKLFPNKPLTVTFDTNTLASVISPETAQRETGASGAAVRAAIEAGRIQGFFSETLVTLEGVEKKDRVDVLGKTRLVSGSSSGGKYEITLTIGFTHFRNELSTRVFERIRAAVTLGMRGLRAPARFGSYHAREEICPLFMPPGGMPELLRCMDGVNKIATEMARRHVGQAVAVELGVHFSQRDHVSEPELWLQGLGRARNKTETEKVAKAISEYADGDSIASHYGFGIEKFCSDDFGKGAAGPSVLDRDHRKWLADEFGLQFVTLSELAERVAT
jgi:hypothetical protein